MLLHQQWDSKVSNNTMVKKGAVLCFCIIPALPHDGRNYRPKHFVLNMMNKYI